MLIRILALIALTPVLVALAHLDVVQTFAESLGRAVGASSGDASNCATGTMAYSTEAFIKLVLAS